MSSKEKLVKRFLQIPKDLRYEELETLLKSLGYVPYENGSSHLLFKRPTDGKQIFAVKPHPKGSPVPPYLLRQIRKNLIANGDLKNG